MSERDRKDIAKKLADREFTFDLPRRPLNVGGMLERGALRLTHPGTGQGGYNPNLPAENYSVVSRVNDQMPGSVTPTWPNKPQSYDIAREDINAPITGNQGLIYDAKYQQLLQSARDVGMRDEELYLDYQ